MSKTIAPGKWKPIKRKLAKTCSFVAGVAMILGGLRMGQTLVEGVQNGLEPTMWGALIVLVPIAIGSVGVFPGILTPIFYRLIDKFMKDSPE